MSGHGRSYLRRALESIEIQEISNVEVVISDDSKNDEIEEECRHWARRLKIQYLRHRGRNLPASTKLNQAIDRCQSPIVKVLCQDDTLFHKSSVKETIEGLSQGQIWLVSAYLHIDKDGKKIGSHIPKLHPRIERVNSIGSHSSLAFLRDRQVERFDERLFWRMDCELYRRILDKYGAPMILDRETVCVRQWEGQSTNSIVKRADRIREWLYVARKYPRKSKAVC
jgi:glycosyltransferase involved in cell wall biosynthesis